MPKFGGRGERPGRPTNIGNQHEIYIKGFPKDTNRFVFWIFDNNPPYLVDEAGNPILNDRDKKIPGYYNFEQHYDPRLRRSWPCSCSQDNPACVGCEFPVEDPTDEKDRGLAIQSTSSAYIVPIVDEQGYVGLYQFGYGVWTALCNIYEDTGSVTDCWISVRKDQQGQKINYTVTKLTNKTDKPEARVAIPDEAYLDKALGKRYDEAIKNYDYDLETGFGDRVSDEIGVSDEDRAEQAKVREMKDKAVKGVHTERNDDSQEQADLGADAPADEHVGEWDKDLNAREASVGELKDWLDNVPEKFGGPIEYGRSGRPALVGMVEKAQQRFDEPPF